MPAVNYTDRGWRGIDWPSFEVFWRNLFDLDWGMYAFCPLLLLGLVPWRVWGTRDLIVPLRERRAIAIFVLDFLLFRAANRYSLMQWNTGFRYLLPLVPFIYLALCDHLVRLPRWAVWALAVPSVLHTRSDTLTKFLYIASYLFLGSSYLDILGRSASSTLLDGIRPDSRDQHPRGSKDNDRLYPEWPEDRYPAVTANHVLSLVHHTACFDYRLCRWLGDSGLRLD